MTVRDLAVWGFFGAFVYAAPRLLVGLSSRRTANSIGEFIVALSVGAIGSAAFGQFVGDTIHQNSQSNLRAVCVIVGMISNPVAPTIVHLLGTGVVRRLGGAEIRKRTSR